MNYTHKIEDLLSTNTYPGRGIIIGKSADGKKAMIAYFIMGRSVNSRNRIFEMHDIGMRTKAYDESKLTDPHLIIYNPYLFLDNIDIITNGDQTDTIYDAIKAGGTFEDALMTREFEDDVPNYTPRISGILNYKNGDFTYKMSILKSANGDGSVCNRYFYSYQPRCGYGHFIHTYKCDGTPIPSFYGEPEEVKMPNTAKELEELCWNNLNEDNKVSLFIKTVDLESFETEVRIVNKNQ